MFDLSVAEVMDPTRVLTLPPGASVTEAAQLMARNEIGAVLVVENERLVGIFTERDALFRVIACGLDVRTTRLADVMTAEPSTVGPESSYGYALLMMQEKGFRHAPVVDNGKLVGIVSSRNAMDPELEEFVPEVRRRAHIRSGH